MASDYAPNQILPGTVYQVIRTLGSAGTGTVYEVEDTTVGKRYVLKTLHAELRHREELAARITREARTLAKLSHVNIVEVVTAGATTDELRLPYFVMQMLNGHTLRAILDAKGALPLSTALSIAIDLLDALDHAHAHGVIHRDVKPDNVFIHRTVSGTTVTKLLDFGVMRLLSSSKATTGHRFLGSLRYAQPEQLSGGPITAQTDLYGAALVLYEMIAGKGPFDDAATEREAASAHLHRAPPPLGRHARVPRALEDLVASALAKDPAARPRDAFTFATRLRDLSAEIDARPSDPPSIIAADAIDDAGPLPLLDQSTMRGTVQTTSPPAARARSMMPLYAVALAVCGVTAAMVVAPALRRGARPPAATADAPVPATATDIPSTAALPVAPVASATQASPRGVVPSSPRAVRPSRARALDAGAPIAPPASARTPDDASPARRLPGPGF